MLGRFFIVLLLALAFEGNVFALEDASEPCVRPVAPVLSQNHDLRQLELLLLASSNGTGDRGNGDAVKMKDGSWRFYDTLSEDEKKQTIKPDPSVWKSAKQCSPKSFFTFQRPDGVLERERENLISLQKSASPRVLRWFIAASLVWGKQTMGTDQDFDDAYHRNWIRSGPVPRENMVPVDFSTGPITLFRQKVYDKLLLDDKVAAETHAAVRVGLADWFNSAPQGDEFVTKVTRAIIGKEDPKTLDQLFHTKEVDALGPDTESLLKQAQGVVNDPDPTAIWGLQTNLDEYKNRFFGKDVPSALIFKIAADAPLNGFSDIPNLDFFLNASDDLDRGWARDRERFENLRKLLKKLAESPKGKDLAPLLSTWNEVANEFYSQSMVAGFNATKLRRGEANIGKSLRTDQKTLLNSCEIYKLLLTVDPKTYAFPEAPEK